MHIFFCNRDLLVSLAPEVSKVTRVRGEHQVRLARKENKATRVSKVTWEKRERGETQDPTDRLELKDPRAPKEVRAQEVKPDPQDP